MKRKKVFVVECDCGNEVEQVFVPSDKKLVKTAGRLEKSAKGKQE